MGVRGLGITGQGGPGFSCEDKAGSEARASLISACTTAPFQLCRSAFHRELSPRTEGHGHCPGWTHGTLQWLPPRFPDPSLKPWHCGPAAGREGHVRAEGRKAASAHHCQCLFIYHVTVVTAGKSRRGIAARQCI